MKIVKTALVSTISLGIAMSTAALAAGPLENLRNSPAWKKAAEGPRIPTTGKKTCASNVLATAAGVATDVGLGITFTIGIPRALTLTFSSDLIDAGAAAILSYTIDGGAQTFIGPAVLSNDTAFATRTAVGITTAPFLSGPLTVGTHTIVPFVTTFGAGSVQFRCFIVAP